MKTKAFNMFITVVYFVFLLVFINDGLTYTCYRKNEKKGHLFEKIQDTRNIIHRTMMPQSPSK